jgi:hypothetical protein
MIEFLTQTLQSDTLLDPWLRHKRIDRLLGEFYEPTVHHLSRMRAAFRDGLFQREGGVFKPLLGDGLKVDRGMVGTVDLVLGNNYLHWPVQERRKAHESAGLQPREALAQACRDALWPLASVLRRGGIALFMEPKEFVMLDEDLEYDARLDQHAISAHPVCTKFHQAVNHVLENTHGRSYPLPAPTQLFRTSELPALVHAGGFALRRIHHVEWVYNCDPVATYFVRLPLVLGGIKELSLHEKLKIGERVRQELAKTLTDEELQTPVRVQWFFFILERVV